jgi:hypothetical protein
LKQTWWRWKADSKFYKSLFHKNFPIPTFRGSKRAVKRRRKIWAEWQNCNFWVTDFMSLGLPFQVYLRAFWSTNFVRIGDNISKVLEAILFVLREV